MDNTRAQEKSKNSNNTNTTRWSGCRDVLQLGWMCLLIPSLPIASFALFCPFLPFSLIYCMKAALQTMCCLFVVFFSPIFIRTYPLGIVFCLLDITIRPHVGTSLRPLSQSHEDKGKSVHAITYREQNYDIELRHTARVQKQGRNPTGSRSTLQKGHDSCCSISPKPRVSLATTNAHLRRSRTPPFAEPQITSDRSDLNK